MYVPPHFAETNPETLQAFIAQHGFATLVSWEQERPVASHLPLLWEPADGTPGRLLGHMARANDQWRSAAGQRVLAIFHGPHAYISPAWYAARNVVPTWNYVAVHVAGTLTLMQDDHRLREVIQQLVAKYEAFRPQPWTIESEPPDFIERLLNAVVGFEVAIDNIEGKWKLSQNHPAERRERTVQALSQSNDEGSREIARLMQAALPSH